MRERSSPVSGMFLSAITTSLAIGGNSWQQGNKTLQPEATGKGQYPSHSDRQHSEQPQLRKLTRNLSGRTQDMVSSPTTKQCNNKANPLKPRNRRDIGRNVT